MKKYQQNRDPNSEYAICEIKRAPASFSTASLTTYLQLKIIIVTIIILYFVIDS